MAKNNKTLLKRSKFRLTKQRKVILKELRKIHTHPSADEVYALVRKRLPRISLGTVYRNLEILSESGEIQKLALGCTLKRFDGNPTRHYHIRCVRCDRIVDAPGHIRLEVDDVLEGSTDFEILGHQLEFVGICPQCAKNSDPAA